MTLPKPPTPLSLSVDHLTVYIQGKCQVHDITLSIGEGNALAITGPVNSGKSALLWAINGLLSEAPSATFSGEVGISGVDNRQVPVAELRRRVGLLITAPLARTPFAELALPLQGKQAAQAGAEVEQALRLVGLWRDLRDRLHQPYNSNDPVLLRLLTLARTMILQPGLLLLDDPTRGLDSMGRARFEEAVTNIAATGHTTLIWATREPDQAGRVADNMAFLCAGEIVETGPAGKLFEHPSDPRTESFLTGDYKKLVELMAANVRQVKGEAR